MYGGGIGALLLVAAVFLISSPSGMKPDLPETKPQAPETTEQAETREPPSTPVTLSEPQILPDDQPASGGTRKAATPARLRREEPASEEPVRDSAPEKAAPDAVEQGPVEQPADPPVSLSRLDVRSAALTQQQTSTPAPGPKQTPKAPEIKKLQQPLIPDAILRSGMTGDVTVLVEIDSEGKPVSSRVTRSTLPALNDLFIEAVMASEFTPGVSADGRTTTYLSIAFKVGR